MVSIVREDFPEPDTPVTTISLFRGNETSTFLRLCTRAPFTTIGSNPALAFFDSCFAGACAFINYKSAKILKTLATPTNLYLTRLSQKRHAKTGKGNCFY